MNSSPARNLFPPGASPSLCCLAGGASWSIECHNEWCSGSERYRIVSGPRPKQSACPACGWIALPGSGIRRIPEEEIKVVDIARRLVGDAETQLRTELDRVKAERGALAEALRSIETYGEDMLSGRSDGPDDREWLRAGVREITRRARAALDGWEGGE